MLVFNAPFVIIAIFFKQVQIDHTLKLSLILGYTGAAVLASAMNDIFLAKKLFDTAGEYMKKENFKSLRICDNFYQFRVSFPCRRFLLAPLPRTTAPLTAPIPFASPSNRRQRLPRHDPQL